MLFPSNARKDIFSRAPEDADDRPEELVPVAVLELVELGDEPGI